MIRTLPLRRHLRAGALALFMVLSSGIARAEVMLQWFESDWDEMYRRMPEVAEIGYDFIWTPPPTKGPTGKGTIWANVGYNLYDRFDLGQVPQRGSLETRYGSLGSLRNMVRAAHALDVKIIPDIIMNHNGNGPDFREYPGMVPEDFHVQWAQGHANTLNYRRGPRMDQWSPDNGTNGTMWMELAQLIDIRTEDAHDPNRFTGGNNTPGWNLVAGQSLLRHPGQYDRYPYFPNGYGPERVDQMLFRWITWLGDMMDYDGLRLDAGKHVPWEFFGTRGNGFLHEAQWNYNERRGHTDSNADEADQLFQNYLAERDDALIFAEILSPWDELKYWYGYSGNDRNPMRFLDYQMKKHADSKFNGDLNGLGSFGSDYGPNNGITYVWGHDEGPASKANLAYAYILGHIGLPMVYFTGNNIIWDNYGRNPYDPGNPTRNKTWMIPGHDSQALGDLFDDIPNLVWIHQQFAWGNEQKLWEGDGNYFALERWFDADGNGREAGDALMVLALNDSGGTTARTLGTSFAQGTVLKDYTGNNPNEVTVGVGGNVSIEVPGMGGQGWVCYAPKTADPLHLEFSGPGVGLIDWVVPGGVHAPSKSRQFTRITNSNLTLNARFATPGGAVDKVMFKWGQGKTRLGTNPHYTNVNDFIVGNYEELSAVNATNWALTVTLPPSIPEGLNVVKIRAFNARTPGAFPALYNTQTEVVYVDRHGPELEITHPLEGQTVTGDAVMIINNPDYSAYGMTVAVNGVTNTAHEIMKGLWKFSLVNLPAGPHTITVTATEADWATPRTVINQSVSTRNITIAPNPHPISLAHLDGATLELPFFKTAVTAGGSPASVRLYWDGYRLPFNGGTYTNVFDGAVIFDADPANVTTSRLWGAFVNGQHFFEAVRVDNSVTSRAVARVTFNLFGGNHIDSDGDGLPDNVEMPFFSDGAPGPDQPWPGDDNDFVPENGENWSRLNPYNHSTFYNGQWDDRQDFDGDGFTNFEEVYAGYVEDSNIYKYNIYNGTSKPTGIPLVSSAALWSPEPVARGGTLTVTYSLNEGPLQNATSVVMHVGHSKKTMGTWQDVIDTNMVDIGAGQWQVQVVVPTNATSMDFTFWNATDTWDGKDWQAAVLGATNRSFTMNGAPDGNDYVIVPGGGGRMEIRAAVSGNNLYVSTYNAGGGGNDHFIFITDELGDAMPAPWAKAGQVFFDTANKPYLVAEGQNASSAWFNADGVEANGPSALEGEINLVDVFGSVPEALYMTAVAYGTPDGGPIYAQGPDVWVADNNLDIMEFQRVPVASIRDEDLDGTFDGGKPQLWTVVGSNTNDANYGLRRFFLNELAAETAQITVILQPNVGAGNTVSDVELFSNINRRDFAVIEEDPSLVTVGSVDTYYRAYPMQDIGGGRYSVTIPIHKCGAYRINARYKVNGGPAYRYYTDHGLRRDCAVVVSPRKALDITMYELNPMFAEATDDTFFGRSTFKDMYLANTNKPDRINPAHFTSLGVNMIWLQPIHPIGSDNRGIDPLTQAPFDPGSPYAVRNYWKVNSVLGDPATEDNAMTEFTNFVAAMDAVGVGIMLDGTFNHSAWDCEIGDIGVDWYDWATTPTAFIRDVRPQWYSRRDRYDLPASYYFSKNDTDMAAAPDRIDFGKWDDAADFRFGGYDTLVQRAAGNTNNAWSSAWYNRYLREDDRFFGHDTYTREIWEYFAHYPLYWLERTGHPAGTLPADSNKGIDGLRCDFAQGLPNLFWEYCINKTRSVKWDFLFMAESLDGSREVAGSNRHGVGFRSARHFDILNENFVFYWRNKFFDYPARNNPQPFTAPTRTEYDTRRQAFDASPLLLNLTSHDEIFPSHDPYRILYAYAELAALDGAPMLFYGQEAGARNDTATYNNGGEIPNANHNFAHYELNFGKAIPNFKRYNAMVNIWNNRDWTLQTIYGRISQARLDSPALRSQGVYFIERTDSSAPDPDIFAVAKFEQPGVSASTQDVVFAFVNNNYWASEDRQATFKLNPTLPDGRNWFGIEAGKSYNIVDLIATNPATYIWNPNRTGADLIANGIFVRLNKPALQGGQAQFLKLVDVSATYPDADNDGIPDYSDWDDDNDNLPDAWESEHGLDPHSQTGNEGQWGDKDGDGISNYEEFLAGTDPNDSADALAIASIAQPAAQKITVAWPSVPEYNYSVEAANRMTGTPAWERVYGYVTALTNAQSFTYDIPANATNGYLRVRVKP